MESENKKGKINRTDWEDNRKMQHFAEFKLVEGCSPCSFMCTYCERNCYRCMTGEQMFIWENKYTLEIYSILCGHCYQECPQGLGKSCLLFNKNYSEYSESRE